SPARMPCASSSGVPRLRRPAVLPPKAPGAARRPACACPFWSCPYLSRLGRPGTSPAQNEPRPESALRRWHHAVHVYDVKPQTGNPEHERGQGGLIGQLSAKGGRARPHVDLAVVEFSADRGAGLAREGDLVSIWTHLVHASKLLIQRAASLAGGAVRVITHPRVTRDHRHPVKVVCGGKPCRTISGRRWERLNAGWPGRRNCGGNVTQAMPPGREPARPARFAPAKFRPTTLPTALVARSRLLEGLSAGAGRRLTVVVGSAGAGKSVLLSNWAAVRSPGVASWLSCDSGDADPVRFWTGFIEACRMVAPDFGADAFDLLAMDNAMSADVTASIANDA